MKRLHFIFSIIILTGIFNFNPVSAQVSNVYISEIMYDTPLQEDKFISGDHNNGEYIKLFNPTNQTRDISGWILKGTNDAEQFVFPAGTTIDSKATLIVAYKSNTTFDFKTYYHLTDNNVKVINQNAIILYNRGESLKLYNSSIRLVDGVAFGCAAPQNTTKLYAYNGVGASGQTHSLQRDQVSYKNGKPVSLGNSDLSYATAAPSAPGHAFVNNTTLDIPPALPAGISSPEIWFKTVQTSPDLNGIYKWQDFSPNKSILKVYDPQGISYGVENMVTRDDVRTYNFNPALNLSKANISKEIYLKNSNLAQATIMGVWGVSDPVYAANNYMFALNGRRNEGVLYTQASVIPCDSCNKTLMTYGNGTEKNLLFQNNVDINTNRFFETALRISTYYKANKPNTSLWGESQNSVISLGSVFSPSDVNNTSTFKNAALSNQPFTGYSPELIVYDRVISPYERSLIESYLAIKYGLSLTKSYYSSTGNLIWDYASNSEFKNRITAYERDDKSDFSQKTSTTSYEEAPYFSGQTAYDSYDSNNSYRQSSRYRLLVMGCQPGNSLNDGEYVIFGDNGGTLTLPPKTSTSSNGNMNREWMLCTNRKPTLEQNKVLSWNPIGLTMTTVGFKSVISAAANNAGTVVTDSVLKSTDGYMAWTVGAQAGPLTIKFGTNSPTLSDGSNDYGYSISANGAVSPIIKGVPNSSVLTISSGQRIEFEKNGTIFYLRINGLRSKESQIEMEDPTDIDKQYYGSISVSASPSGFSMTDFRHGGFVDTGNRVELSYYTLRASDFVAYANSQAYLIIDRTGAGDFTNADYYPCDEVDTNRSKIIFNNIFWNTSGKGRDVFTFGYKVPVQNKAKKTQDPPAEPEIKDTQLAVYYKDLKDMSTVTAKIQLFEPAPATLVLFDIMGKLIYRQELPLSKETQYIDLKLPTTSVYIVKVITNQGELSTKIISKITR